MARVVCGVDKHGTRHDEPCYARDAEILEEGKWITIPDDYHGGTMEVRLCGAQLATAGDMLGVHAMLPINESPSAHLHCRSCYRDTREDKSGRPFSFLRRPAPTPGSSKAARLTFTRRTWDTLKPLINGLRAASDTERAAGMKAHGLNKLIFALDPEYIANVDPTQDVPQDILHLFPDGLLRSEAAWLFYVLCKLGLDLSLVNDAIARFPDWPPDVRIPPLHANLRKGRKGSRPAAERCLRMTGSQVMHFALHRCAVSHSLVPLCPLALPAALLTAHRPSFLLAVRS